MAKTTEVTMPMLRKVVVGDALTKLELELAIKFYTELSGNLDKILFVEKGYEFAAQHARRELERLNIFANNRKNRKLKS